MHRKHKRVYLRGCLATKWGYQKLTTCSILSIGHPFIMKPIEHLPWVKLADLGRGLRTSVSVLLYGILHIGREAEKRDWQAKRAGYFLNWPSKEVKKVTTQIIFDANTGDHKFRGNFWILEYLDKLCQLAIHHPKSIQNPKLFEHHDSQVKDAQPVESWGKRTGIRKLPWTKKMWGF